MRAPQRRKALGKWGLRVVYIRWLWRECDSCHDELKREHMWRFSIPWCSPAGRCTSMTYHLCLRCAPGTPDAVAYADAKVRADR